MKIIIFLDLRRKSLQARNSRRILKPKNNSVKWKHDYFFDIKNENKLLCVRRNVSKLGECLGKDNQNKEYRKQADEKIFSNIREIEISLITKNGVL